MVCLVCLFQCYHAFNIVSPEIFVNNVKRHVCDTKKPCLQHDLPILVNGRVISPFREDFNFTLAKFRENKTFVKISEFEVFERTSEIFVLSHMHKTF